MELKGLPGFVTFIMMKLAKHLGLKVLELTLPLLVLIRTFPLALAPSDVHEEAPKVAGRVQSMLGRCSQLKRF